MTDAPELDAPSREEVVRWYQAIAAMSVYGKETRAYAQAASAMLEADAERIAALEVDVARLRVSLGLSQEALSAVLPTPQEATE